MNAIEPAVPAIRRDREYPAAIKDNFPPARKRMPENDIVLNVDFKNAMIRFGITLVLPMFILFIDHRLIIYTAPVMAYLFTSSVTHFCVIKYLWHRYFKHEPSPVPMSYGKDPYYPEESL